MSRPANASSLSVGVVFVVGVPRTAVLYGVAFGFPGLLPVIGAGVPRTALLYVGAFGFPGLFPVFGAGVPRTAVLYGVAFGFPGLLPVFGAGEGVKVALPVGATPPRVGAGVEIEYVCAATLSNARPRLPISTSAATVLCAPVSSVTEA